MDFPTFDELLDIDCNNPRWYNLQDLPNEEWQDIQGYEGLYQVSNYGRVKSLGRISKRKSRWGGQYTVVMKEKIKTPFKNNKGYYMIHLNNNGKESNLLIHRLVGKAFIPNPYNNPEIDHKNENKNDNKINNLTWCTRLYNNTKGVQSKDGRRNSSRFRMRPVRQYDLQGNLLNIYEGIRIAEEKTSIDNRNIVKCCKGKEKTAGGFIWRYDDE